MKTKSRATMTHGTARDLAENGVGYTASGEGEWSRNSARPGNTKMNGYEEPQPPKWFKDKEPKATSAQTIATYQNQIEKLRHKLRTERDPDRVAKLILGIKIKTDLIARGDHD